MVSHFMIFTLVLLGMLGDTCGGSCPSNDCPACICGENSNSRRCCVVHAGAISIIRNAQERI